MSVSFRRQANIPFTTMRQPPVTAGKRTGPVPYLLDEGLRCTPLDPADPGGKGEILQRLITESPVQLLETTVGAELDIAEGDLLVVAGREYPVKAVADWAWRGRAYLSLILEDQHQASPGPVLLDDAGDYLVLD